MGTYGILRFVFPLFPLGIIFWTPLICILSILGVIYGALACIRQVDLKKIVAYSSVSHLNFCILGLFSYNIYGLQGGLFLMLSHGFVSSALFLLIGCLYERYKSRLLIYYSGLVNIMPLFTTFLFIFVLSNLSFPGTSSFIGEILIFIGLFLFNPFIAFLSTITVVLSSIYSLWFFNRISFGKLNKLLLYNSCDLTLREFAIILPLLLGNLVIGLKSVWFSNLWYILLLNIIITIY